MSAAFTPDGLYQLPALPPFSNQRGDYFGRHCRMICGVNEHSSRRFRDLAQAARDRSTHLAMRIGIDSKTDPGIRQMVL
jgi:hypothetical protein